MLVTKYQANILCYSCDVLSLLIKGQSREFECRLSCLGRQCNNKRLSLVVVLSHGPNLASFLFIFVLLHNTTTNTVQKFTFNASIVCLGFEHATAGWQALINPPTRSDSLFIICIRQQKCFLIKVVVVVVVVVVIIRNLIIRQLSIAGAHACFFQARIKWISLRRLWVNNF